jgi:hypothetical protein
MANSDYKNVQTHVAPEVVPPTPENTAPRPAANEPVRLGDQVTATRQQLRVSGLNLSALSAIEAGNAAIDKQSRR